MTAMRIASFALLALLACQTPQPSDPGAAAMVVLRAVGDAALRVDGYRAVERVAPEILPLVDLNQDRILTLDEVEQILSLATTSPETFAGLLAAAYVLLRERH